jgi:hypothetical protein
MQAKFTKTYLSYESYSILSMSSATTSSNELKCEECGITFTTIQDKEQHIKLEHEESRRPTGVK